MKTKLLLVLAGLPLAVMAQFEQQPALRLSPAQPAPGQPLTLTYTPARPMPTPQLTGYALVPDASPKALALPLQASGKSYTATFTVPADAKALAFSFKDENDTYDPNQDLGYGTLLYQNGRPLAGSRSEAARWLQQWGSLTGVDFSDRATLRKYFEQDFKENPEAKKTYFLQYLRMFSPRSESEQLKKGVAELEAMPDLTENQLTFLAGMYDDVLNDKARAERYRKLIAEKYPNGSNALQGSLEKESAAFNAEKDFEKKKAIYTDLVQRYGNNKEASGFIINLSRRMVASFVSAGKLPEAAATVTDPQAREYLMTIYTNTAWGWAEKGEKLPEAEQLARQATEWARTEIGRPRTATDPAFLSDEQLKNQARSRYARHANIHAAVLAKQGKTQQALPLMQEITVGIAKYKDAAYNERYAKLLAAAGQGKALRELAEKAIAAGKSTTTIDSLLRRQYIAEKGSDRDFDTYVAGFRKAGQAARQAAMMRKMIDKPAPEFTLTDLQGNRVSLADLKGKVAIVDFWATWCGPCVASFPAMQKAVQHYKNDPNVKFLFVNTWQQEADKKKNAADFMAKKGYDFQVLLDEDDEVVSKFGVSGIPTKFVIGPDGRIRFKAVGFEPGEAALIAELSGMIELANNLAAGSR